MQINTYVKYVSYIENDKMVVQVKLHDVFPNKTLVTNILLNMLFFFFGIHGPISNIMYQSHIRKKYFIKEVTTVVTFVVTTFVRGSLFVFAN